MGGERTVTAAISILCPPALLWRTIVGFIVLVVIVTSFAALPFLTVMPPVFLLFLFCFRGSIRVHIRASTQTRRTQSLHLN